MRYAWQTKPWQQFWQSVQADRMPHALLLTGMAGIGKLDFAKHAAQALLCSQVDAGGDPCCACHACRLVTTEAHPDVIYVRPEKEGHAIKVDQIRDLAEFIQQSSLQGGKRIAIIYPAHSMNINAANALLKTLEEPAAGAMMILVTDQYGYLPATIRSRCQRIAFQSPDHDAALHWLKTQPTVVDIDVEQLLRLANGAPLLAANMASESLSLRSEMLPLLQKLAERRVSPLKLAAEWQKQDPISWLNLFASWLSDLIKLQSGARAEQLCHQDFMQALTACSKQISLQRNVHILQYINQLQAELRHGINFNKQLMVENLLIRWSEQAV